MTLQSLTYFIAAAESGSFTKAAQHCFVSQPALSRAIADLEEELGYPLFVRGKTLLLTPSGRACLDEARQIVRLCDGMREKAQHAALGTKKMTVGYIVLGHYNVFRRFISHAQLSQQFPQIEFDTVYMDLPKLEECMQDGSIDLAVLSEACTQNLLHRRCITLSQGGDAIIVSRHHRLFERESVHIAELKDEDLILYDPQELYLANRAYTQACVDAGFSPRIVGHGRKMGDIVAQVTLKRAIGFTSLAFRYLEESDVRVIPLCERIKGFDIVLVGMETYMNQEKRYLFDLLCETPPLQL